MSESELAAIDRLAKDWKKGRPLAPADMEWLLYAAEEGQAFRRALLRIWGITGTLPLLPSPGPSLESDEELTAVLRQARRKLKRQRPRESA